MARLDENTHTKWNYILYTKITHKTNGAEMLKEEE